MRYAYMAYEGAIGAPLKAYVGGASTSAPAELLLLEPWSRKTLGNPTC